MLIGVVVFLFSLYHVDIWGILLGAGLVFAPLTAGRMFLMYVALVGIPLGMGLALGAAAKQIFGPGLMAGVGFFGGILIGGKFVLSDTFDKMLSKKPSPEPPVPPSSDGPG